MLNARAGGFCFAFPNTQEYRADVCKGTDFLLSPHPPFLGTGASWCLVPGVSGVSGSVLAQETGREHGECPWSLPSRQGLELPHLGAAALNAGVCPARAQPGSSKQQWQTAGVQRTDGSAHKACEEEPQKRGRVRMLVKHWGGGWVAPLARGPPRCRDPLAQDPTVLPSAGSFGQERALSAYPVSALLSDASVLLRSPSHKN